MKFSLECFFSLCYLFSAPEGESITLRGGGATASARAAGMLREANFALCCDKTSSFLLARSHLLEAMQRERERERDTGVSMSERER